MSAGCALPSPISWLSLSWHATCCTCGTCISCRKCGGTTTRLTTGSVRHIRPRPCPPCQKVSLDTPPAEAKLPRALTRIDTLPVLSSLTWIDQTTNSRSPSSDRYSGDILISGGTRTHQFFLRLPPPHKHLALLHHVMGLNWITTKQIRQ